MLGLFKKDKHKVVLIKAPLKGRVMDISEVPDLVFSQKMVGDGIAIEPIEGSVAAPIDGEVLQVMDTKHAIGLMSKEGIELLIHIGIDTVDMKGEGFEIHVAAGDRVRTGDLLITFDLDKVRGKAKSTITPVVITNMEALTTLEKSLMSEDEWVMKVTIEG